MKRFESGNKGFKTPEILMLALIFAVLAVVGIPSVSNYKSEAKNAAALAALGEMRGQLAFASKLIALREDPLRRRAAYPTVEELKAGVFLEAHPSLKGKSIFDPALGTPKNPWTARHLPEVALTEIHECEFEKGRVLEDQDRSQRGWCYRPSTGEIWLNTNQNRAPAGETENHY